MSDNHNITDIKSCLFNVWCTLHSMFQCMMFYYTSCLGSALTVYLDFRIRSMVYKQSAASWTSHRMLQMMWTPSANALRCFTQTTPGWADHVAALRNQKHWRSKFINWEKTFLDLCLDLGVHRSNSKKRVIYNLWCIPISGELTYVFSERGIESNYSFDQLLVPF